MREHQKIENKKSIEKQRVLTPKFELAPFRKVVTTTALIFTLSDFRYQIGYGCLQSGHAYDQCESLAPCFEFFKTEERKETAIRKWKKQTHTRQSSRRKQQAKELLLSPFGSCEIDEQGCSSILYLQCHRWCPSACVLLPSSPSLTWCARPW